MLRFLDSIPYPVLTVAAILMLLAPFEPMAACCGKAYHAETGNIDQSTRYL